MWKFESRSLQLSGCRRI